MYSFFFLLLFSFFIYSVIIFLFDLWTFLSSLFNCSMNGSFILTEFFSDFERNCFWLSIFFRYSFSSTTFLSLRPVDLKLILILSERCSYSMHTPEDIFFSDTGFLTSYYSFFLNLSLFMILAIFFLFASDYCLLLVLLFLLDYP